MRLTFLGATQEVGRSGVFAQGKDISLILDAGVKLNGHTEFPLDAPAAADAVVVTHAHLDHSGNLPRLFSANGKKTVFMTPPTIPLVSLLLDDCLGVFKKKNKPPYFTQAEARKFERHAVAIGYREPYEFFDGSGLEFFDAGHIVGSGQALVRFAEGKTLLYTGDMKTQETRMHKGAQMPKEKVDALVMECTYASLRHPDRKKLEKKFCDEVSAAIESRQPVLVPCFAIGRAQELLQVLDDRRLGAEIYVDGMIGKTTQIMLNFPEYVKDYEKFRKSVKNAHFVTSGEKRKKLGKAPAVIISTAGMLDGGPALTYLKTMAKEKRGKVFLTGYQVEGSNGRRLLDTGRVKFNGEEESVGLQAAQYDFSAHSDGEEMFNYAKKINAEKVYCIHGKPEYCEAMAARLRAEGFDATAPKPGERFET